MSLYSFCGGNVSFYFVGHEYSSTMRRNLIYTYPLEFVGCDILFGKGRVEILVNGN